ncbi:HAD family hydrolase [Mediterraneibacter massiliensis]|jgi:phosphoglycolate phosphatase|uniref:HAD family hydrolase n=1 Tax=Mediterraneibacter massiliensis TaxID=1720300 RepID=UPI0022E36644|nr:HAD family hydrolase [Mediterraneibacter massiliensis]
MKWDTIIFDLDGTLLNSLKDIANSANYTMGKLGFPEKEIEEIKGVIGKGAAYLLDSCLPLEQKENRTVFNRALQIFKEHYFLHGEENTIPYKGAEAFLKDFQKRGMKMAVVSNKPDEVAQKIVRRFFGDSISCIFGEKSGIAKKPAPDLVYAALKSLDSDRTGAVYIGDSEVDVLTAKNAGLPVILVTWGYRDKKILKTLGAEYMVDDFEELSTLLIKEE